MKRVLASGVFDILHAGHLFYLKEAKALGDHLVVIVTSDSHATRTKRPPMHDEQERAELVASLKPVDEVIIGADPYDLIATTKAADPDVIALGYDQTFNETKLREQLFAGGIDVAIARLREFPHGTRKTRSITNGVTSR